MPGDDERGGGGGGEDGSRPPPFPPGMGDPFRDVRGEGPEGDLMGPASLGLCCAVCCVCTMMSLLIAYLAWAYWTVATSQASASTECGTSYSLWVFCLTVTILVPILGCIVSIITYFTVSSFSPPKQRNHKTPLPVSLPHSPPRSRLGCRVRRSTRCCPGRGKTDGKTP